MMMTVFIEPHERGAILEAYADWLTREQIDEIHDAPDTALVQLTRRDGTTAVTIIPEG